MSIPIVTPHLYKASWHLMCSVALYMYSTSHCNCIISSLQLAHSPLWPLNSGTGIFYLVYMPPPLCCKNCTICKYNVKQLTKTLLFIVWTIKYLLHLSALSAKYCRLELLSAPSNEHNHMQLVAVRLSTRHLILLHWIVYVFTYVCPAVCAGAVRCGTDHYPVKYIHTGFCACTL